MTFISTEIPQPEAKANRGKLLRDGFVYKECYTDIGGLNITGGSAILDCLCNLTANEMFDERGNIRERVVQTVTDGVVRLAKGFKLLIVVTNEVASDGVCHADGVAAYRQALCAINRELALRADCVYELCVAIPTAIKGTLMI